MGYVLLSPCCFPAPCWNLLAVASRDVLCVPSGIVVLSEGFPDSSNVKLERWSVVKDNTGSVFIFQREQHFLRWGTGDTGLFLYSVMLKIVLVLNLDVMATYFSVLFSVSQYCFFPLFEYLVEGLHSRRVPPSSALRVWVTPQIGFQISKRRNIFGWKEKRKPSLLMFLHKLPVSLLYIRPCPVLVYFCLFKWLEAWVYPNRVLMYPAWVSKTQLCLILWQVAWMKVGDPGLLRPVLASRVCVG